MIREILKMLNQYAVDYPTFPVNLRFFPLFRNPGGILSRSVGMPSRNDRPPDIWNTNGFSKNVFANPTASSSAPYPGGFNPWIPNVTEHISLHVTSERQIPDTALDPRCQSGPSARNSFDPNEWRFSKDYGADRQRLQISDLHFDKFPTPTTFACWKIRFKTEVCTCSQFPTEAMPWINFGSALSCRALVWMSMFSRHSAPAPSRIPTAASLRGWVWPDGGLDLKPGSQRDWHQRDPWLRLALRFVPFLDHTEPTQSVTSQNPVILTCKILPGPYAQVFQSADSSTWSHLTSKSWTSSSWRRMVNKSESSCTDSNAPVARKYSWIMSAFCLLRKNRYYFWAFCSWTLTLFRKWTCELRSFFNEHAVSTSSIS